MAGAYILAVASMLLAPTGNQQVIEILSQVLADLLLLSILLPLLCPLLLILPPLLCVVW